MDKEGIMLEEESSGGLKLVVGLSGDPREEIKSGGVGPLSLLTTVGSLTKLC